MKSAKKIATFVSAGSIVGAIMASELYERLHLDQLMPHVEKPMHPPKDIGKFRIVVAVDSVTPIEINLFDNLSIAEDFVTATVSG
jgi:hypothetical protein